MNFQVVSVGEKLIEKSLARKGGYEDSIGTPTPSLLSEIVFADASIGDMVAALKKNGIYEDALIVITAKHGQSPVDSERYLGIANSTGDPVTTSPATTLDGLGCLPASESPSGPGIGATEDDISRLAEQQLHHRFRGEPAAIHVRRQQQYLPASVKFSPDRSSPPTSTHLACRPRAIRAFRTSLRALTSA